MKGLGAVLADPLDGTASCLQLRFFCRARRLRCWAIAGGDIIQCEVLQGYRRQEDRNAARQASLQFPAYPVGGIEMATKSAESYHVLRRQGIMVRKTIGCLIATFIIERGFTLMHSDRDCDPFEATGIARGPLRRILGDFRSETCVDTQAASRCEISAESNCHLSRSRAAGWTWKLHGCAVRGNGRSIQ